MFFFYFFSILRIFRPTRSYDRSLGMIILRLQNWRLGFVYQSLRNLWGWFVSVGCESNKVVFFLEQVGFSGRSFRIWFKGFGVALPSLLIWEKDLLGVDYEGLRDVLWFDKGVFRKVEGFLLVDAQSCFIGLTVVLWFVSCLWSSVS